MARKSISALTTISSIAASVSILTAGQHVPEPARAIFAELVSSVTPGHFLPADRVLLEQLAVAVYVARELADSIERDGVIVDGKVSQAVKVLKQQQALIGSLASRLRLTTQNRISKERAGTVAKGGADSIGELYDLTLLRET